jgi:dGTPase
VIFVYTSSFAAPTQETYLTDRAKIISSIAFRRLGYKTQVFVNHIGDHYRTRLTHTIEVAQIAKYISRKLGLNEDYAEVLALAHDLGHPPFGHAGEDALNAVTRPFGGFDHNAQTLKILSQLQPITKETLIGIAKHNEIKHLHPKLSALCKTLDLNLYSFNALEIDVASLSDDIAYVSHDLEDGIRMSMITFDEMMQIKNFSLFFSEKLAEQSASLSSIVNTTLIADLIDNTTNNISKSSCKNFQDLSNSKEQIVGFSEEIELLIIEIKAFLMQNVYRNFKINRMSFKANNIVGDLFQIFKERPECLPKNWYSKIHSSKHNIHEVIIDYIAGMTDRFAIKEHKNLYNASIF